MRYFLVFFLFLKSSAFINAYPLAQEQHYKSNIYRFYNLIFEIEPNTILAFEAVFGSHSIELEENYIFDQCTAERSENECLETLDRALNKEPDEYPSLIVRELISKKELLTEGLSISEIKKCIKESVIIDSGSPGGVYINLNLNNRTTIYFSVNKYLDEEPTIGASLPSGKSIFNFLSSNSNYQVKRLGKIDDPDGYTNMRSGKGTNYEVIEKIMEDDIFDYYPTNESNWWKVKNLTTCNEGYVHKSRIQPVNLFDKSTPEIIAQKAKTRYEYPKPCSN